MNHIIDLEYILITHSEQAIIDAIYEHACELNCQEIISMIERYWQSKEKRSVKEQSND